MPQSSTSEAFQALKPEYSDSDVGSLTAVIKSIVLKIQTVTLVEIISCTNDGEFSEVGFVDVRPLVYQITGDQKIVEHGIIYNIPYFRLQGGVNAVILDPKPGDIGMCGFCSRDISSVKNNKKASAPGSMRTYDWSDGLYFGGFLNGVPEQYIRFHPQGIEIYSPKNIKIEAAGDVDIIAGGSMKSTSQKEMSMTSSSGMSLSSTANMQIDSSQAMNLNSQQPLNAQSSTQVILTSSQPIGLDAAGITSVGDKDMSLKSKGNINMATEKGIKMEADQQVNVKGSKINLNE